MLFKTALALSLLSCTSASSLRTSSPDAESDVHLSEFVLDHLDLEVLLPNGSRELFPLLPGTKCPTGHTCRTRSVGGTTTGLNPLAASMKENWRSNIGTMFDWQEFNNDLNTVVKSDDFCTRRGAMARAAGLAAGVLASTVNAPAYAAETKSVKMGTDSGQLKFEPEKISICKGDSVKWINNKGGPHNVVFDEDGIPDGVEQEKISMEEQLGEEGDTFVMAFETAGDYDYYCEPHRGAGMNGKLVVA